GDRGAGPGLGVEPARAADPGSPEPHPQITVRDAHGQEMDLPVSNQAVIRIDGADKKLDDLTEGTRVVLVAAGGLVSRIESPTSTNVNWLSLIGVIGILIAFGHSILAMSGEETLAQV